MIEERLASQAFGEVADELLARGVDFRFQAKGRSMWPLIDDGEILHVRQVNTATLKVGDIVLFRQGSKFKAHRIIRKQKQRGKHQFITRGDASRDTDGTSGGGQIVGKIIAKESMQGRATVRLDGLAMRLSFFAAEARRQARKYLSRPPSFARPALLLSVLAFTAFPLAHSQVTLDSTTLVLTQAANAVAGNTTYQGAITGGAANAYVGTIFTVAGFAAGADNGTFICTASTAISLTLANAAGVAQTHAATATSSPTTSIGQVVTRAANTVTLGHNNIAGSNLLLVVGVSMNISAKTTTTVSGVTYNGVALTSAGVHNDSTNVRRVEIWYLINPPAGNNNVVVTVNVPAGGAPNIGTVVGATTFAGVDQTTPIRAFAGNDGNSDSANVTVASSANDLVIDTLAIDAGHTVTAPSGAQTRQWALTSAAAATDVYGYGSTHAGAASVPMGENLSGAIIWSDAAVSIQPSQGDLAVSVTGTSALFPTNLVYTITVKNNGPTAASAVVLTDTLAAGLTFVSAVPSTGSCSGTTTITCNLGSLAVGASDTVTVTVTPGAPGGYPNTASVTSSTTDLANANNSSTGVAYSDFAACATSTLVAGGTLTGTINTYFPGTATATVGSTSITLGTATGAATAIASGDLVLILQMQDAAINSSNSGSYGDGISGSGSTNLNNAGAYEYATATNAVPLTGGTLTVTAAGPGGGLLYTYTSAAATSTQGARTFQVVRVPNFSSATIGAALTGSAWNGSTGGILALNISGALTLGSATVHMDGLGFRGGSGMFLVGSLATLTQVGNAAGGVTVYTGAISGGGANALAGTTFIVAGFTNAANNGTFVATASTATTLTLANAAGVAETHAATASISPGATNSDYLFTSPVSYAGTAKMGADGAKGEGIAGTPHWVQSGVTNLNTNQTYAEGYPNGSMARGAPGNAGGGGTDGDPVATPAPGGNDQNAGGGGGANGGSGGQGGDTWNSNLTTGGFGGAAFPADINRVAMGGGGGAGSSNNNNSTSSSSAAAGGGMILIRAGSLVGTATLTANGANGFNNTASDAGGGGGAGGSIIILTGTGGEAGLTLQAQGGTGGNAWQGQPYSNPNRHGPGGGGGGGVVLTSSVTGTPTISVTGGANGTTLATPVSYGATPGAAGVSVTNLTLTSSPGQHSAAICTDMSITKSGAPQPVLQNTTLTYTVTVTNGGPNTATGVVVVDTLPSQVTYVSAVAAGGGSCSQSGGVVTCNYATMASGLSRIITITVTATTPSLALNTAVVNSATPDPVLSNNTATFTSTIEYPNAVKLNSFVAGQTGPAVLVTWRSGGELHNLGYNVYRESGGSKTQLNPSLIAGSALTMRETVEQHGAKSYAWIDRSPVNGGLYWLEDVDLNGSRTMYGPISVESGPSPTQAVARSAMLSEVARSNAASGRGNAAQSHIREFVVTPAPSKLALNTGFQLAAQPAVKIFVDHEGWYHITQPQLVAAGLNPNLQTSSLHLFAEGVEQSIRVTGAASAFGPQGAIEFYGTAIDTPFSGQRVFWLMSSAQPGLRIPGPSGAGSPGPQAQSFVQTLELKPRTTYFAVLLNENTDNFFGPLVSPVAAIQTLNLSNLAPGGATIQVVLQGATQRQQHDVTVAVNGATLGNINFVGQQQGKGQFTIPSGILANGSNTITLTAQQGSNDLSFIDHIDVSFLQTFTAQSDLLKFSAPAGDSVTVNGFAQPPTRLMDITNPAQPFAVAYTVSPQGGGYALQTIIPWTSSGAHTLLALADHQLAVPASLAPHRPSTLHQPQAGAGVVILAAPQFSAQIQPLAALHRAEGRPVAMLTVDQVYDEFNFGEPTPYAIKNFLQTATTAWTNKPHYLLLGGDASVDPRDYLGFGFFDFVPTKIVVTSELKTASDDWFSDFGNTGYAQIATGRIPARSVSDAQTMVGKILSYASANAQPASWTNNTMLVADTDDPSVSFSQAALAVQKLLPPAMTVNDVFAGTVGVSAARQDILAGINSGQLLVNYNGHGSVQVWGNSLFDDTAAASLTNGNRLPVFVMMNCLNGFFHDVYSQSLAEALLLSPQGGAVAVWASSGLTAPDPQFQMDQALVKTLFAQPSIPLGDAVLLAKSGIADPDTRKTFILFGDPLMRLKQSGVAAQLHGMNQPASRAPDAR